MHVRTIFALAWALFHTETTASLRGLAVVNDRVVWASGTEGTYLRSTTGGETWTVAQVKGAGILDFRDVHAVDERTAYLLASGAADKSRVYKTVNGGKDWTLQLTNPDAAGFFDAMAFWDENHGLLLGDSLNGRMVVFGTDDGGAHWERREGPAAQAKEGAFAASGTCLIANGDRDAWFGTTAARVFHSVDGGRTWTTTQTPIRHDGGGAGIFSLAFADSRNGIAVGGDYTKPESDEHNIAVTLDGGRTWSEPKGARPAGFRSAVAYVPAMKAWVAVGTSGSDISYDNGAHWERFGSDAYNAVAFAPLQNKGWAVGPKGAAAVLRAGAR